MQRETTKVLSCLLEIRWPESGTLQEIQSVREGTVVSPSSPRYDVFSIFSLEWSVCMSMLCHVCLPRSRPFHLNIFILL